MSIRGKLLGEGFLSDIMAIWTISAVGYLLFVLYLWYEIRMSVATLEFSAILGTIILTLIFGIFIFAGIYLSRILSSEYCCTENQINVEYCRKIYSVDLTRGVYLTNFHVRFYIGKGSIVKSYLAFSNDPITIPIDTSGAKAIQKMLWAGIVMIPCEEKAISWIHRCYDILTIPNYPETIYVNRN